MAGSGNDWDGWDELPAASKYGRPDPWLGHTDPYSGPGGEFYVRNAAGRCPGSGFGQLRPDPELKLPAGLKQIGTACLWERRPHERSRPLSVQTHPLGPVVDGLGGRAGLSARYGPPGSAVYTFSHLNVLEGSEQ